MAKADEAHHMSLLSDLTRALSYLQMYGGWMVVLCPDSGVAGEASGILAALVGDVPFSGRTALVHDSKLSIASAPERIFIPADEPFYLTYLGWDGRETHGKTDEWERRATMTVLEF